VFTIKPEAELRTFADRQTVLGQYARAAEEDIPPGEVPETYLGFAQVMAAVAEEIDAFDNLLSWMDLKALLEMVIYRTVHQIQDESAWNARPIVTPNRDEFTARFLGWREQGSQVMGGGQDPGAKLTEAFAQIPDAGPGGWSDAHYAGVCVGCWYGTRILRRESRQQVQRAKATAALKVAMARYDAATAA
jgi:hypothetical protein